MPIPTPETIEETGPIDRGAGPAAGNGVSADASGAFRSWRQAERVLRGSPELYRQIIETTRQGVCVTDSDYRLVFANPRLSQILGYGPGELVGLTAFDLVDDAGACAQRDRMASRRGGPENGEVTLKRKDGTAVSVLYEAHSIFDSGCLRGSLSMVTDISERNAIEARLAHSEAMLRQAQEIAHVGSWDWNLATNVVTRSDEYRRLTRLHGEDAVSLGAPSFDLIHPEDRDRARQAVERALRDRAPWTVEYRLLFEDGVRIVQARGDVVLGADGAPVRLIGTVQDITDKREAEARIMFADRMVSVGTLALGVAHEINNPLAYVITNLDMVSEEIRRLAAAAPSAGLQELEELTHEAREGAERVRKIVRGLKSFSRGDEDRPVALDLQRVLEAAVNMTFNEIRHRARLVRDYGEVPPVLADEGRLGQVFINLLMNAAQSFPETRTERNEIRVVTRTLPDGRALVEVHDTGLGIPSDRIGRIFDPFFTTKAVGMGTGLGLSICLGIVTGLGGELTVESDVRRGSVFRVVLAAAPPGAAPGQRQADSAPPEPESHASVLIVDDDPMVARALGRMLRGHEVALATHGREALDLLLSGRHFDVILCDLMMPVMTGMELHAQLEEKLPHLLRSMVFITGGAFTPSGRNFLDDVPNESLEKPFDARDLRAVVQRAARGRAAAS
jgi:PAS domain S-box-containing protein